MKLILLGTGGPEQNPARISQSSLLITATEHILVDAGRGAVNQLIQMGQRVEDLDRILLTHHHVDHIGDLGVLLLTSWIGGRSVPVRVVGPPGTGDIVTALIDTVYAPDIRWRQAERAAWAAMAPDPGLWVLPDPDRLVEIQEVIDGPVLVEPSLTISAGQTEHGGTYLRLDDWHSVAYRIEAEGKSIVFSGDTAMTEGLVELARGADLLVLNCYGTKADLDDPWGAVFSRTMIAAAGECGRIAFAAGVKKLVLSHLAADLTAESVEADVREYYSGPLVTGVDLMEIVV